MRSTHLTDLTVYMNIDIFLFVCLFDCFLVKKVMNERCIVLYQPLRDAL